MISFRIRSSILIGIVVAAAIATGVVNSYAADKPKNIRIIYTNDMMGYMEPCGCGGRYEGGLTRRSTAIVRLVKENSSTLIVDSGNITGQSINLGTILKLMSDMGYDAIGAGDCETALGGSFFDEAKMHGLSVVDAIALAGRPATPYLLKNVNGVNVGVVSYGADCASVVGSLMSARKTFYSTYKTARDNSDVLILLDQGGIATPDWLEHTGRRMGAPDIVIGGLSNVGLSKEKIIGRTHIVPTSRQGRQLGVIDIAYSSDRSLTMASKMIMVDVDTPEDLTVKKQIDDYVKKLALQILSGDNVDAHKTDAAALMPKSGYIAPETCRDCHPNEYESWSTSKHASAIGTIVAKNRIIPECANCHSEEYRRTSKITGRAKSDDPTGVECSSCHNAVLPHDKNGPQKSAMRKVDTRLCISCHNSERSPDYNEARYLAKIAHTKLK